MYLNNVGVRQAVARVAKLYTKFVGYASDLLESSVLFEKSSRISLEGFFDFSSNIVEETKGLVRVSSNIDGRPARKLMVLVFVESSKIGSGIFDISRKKLNEPFHVSFIKEIIIIFGKGTVLCIHTSMEFIQHCFLLFGCVVGGISILLLVLLILLLFEQEVFGELAGDA